MRKILTAYTNIFSNLQRNIWVLSVAMFINRSGSMVLLFTSLYLTQQLGFTIAQAGLVMSCYGVGCVLGSYAGGWLTDRKNYFSIMVFSLFSSGVVLLMLLIPTNVYAIAAIIFLYAFVADMFRPANGAAMAAYSTAQNRTRSVSLVRLSANLGFSVGPAVGGFIALYLGYKWLFVIDALTSFAAALMLYIYLPRIKPVKANHDATVLGDKRTSAYRDYVYLIFIVLVALYGMTFFQIFASMPQYFSRICHYNEDTIGLLLALNGLLVVLIEMPLIAHIEHRKNVFGFITIGVLCLPVAFAFLFFGKGMIIWAIFYTAFMTMSEIFAMPYMMNYALSRPRNERQGQYSALYSIAFGLSNIAAPSVGLGMADKYGFDKMFLFFIALSFVIALGFQWLKKHN